MLDVNFQLLSFRFTRVRQLSLFPPLEYQKPLPVEIGRFMEILKLAVSDLKTVESVIRVFTLRLILIFSL